MIHRFTEVLSAPARPQVQPVNPESSHQSLLREADDVAGVRRPFKAMEKNDLTAWADAGLVLESYDRVLSVDLINLATSGKALLIYLARPKVARNGGQMGMPKKRFEFGTQTKW